MRCHTIFLAFVVAFAASPNILHSETSGVAAICERESDAQSADVAGTVAEMLLRSIEQSISQFELLVGRSFDTINRADPIDTPEGSKRPVDVYVEFLRENGYPSPSEIRPCMRLLAGFGLDNPGQMILLLPSLNPDHIDHITASLRLILHAESRSAD